MSCPLDSACECPKIRLEVVGFSLVRLSVDDIFSRFLPSHSALSQPTFSYAIDRGNLNITMRLINVKTVKLEKFLDNNVPPYAILSHTWKDDEELTLGDIEEGRTDKPGIGSDKLQKCCRQAEKDGLGYIWIDTCCIDKTNSVELGEAINSMFRWYKKADICYVYLLDVPGEDNPQNLRSEFRKSRWFKRGWTLQELLAPQRLQFYSSDWRCLGTKGKMCNTVEMITGIPRQFLLGIEQLRKASVAQRMSWAAHRDTTREEDIAYCLLGIFGVMIPMIYGEGGEQAFFRLQEQIMKTTRDDSILAWGLSLTDPISNYATEVTPGRILAASPSDFANCKHIISREQASTPIHSLDISGGSLRIHLSLLGTSASETIGLLQCGPEDGLQKVVGIPLSNARSTSFDEYIRPRGSHSVLLQIDEFKISPKLIYIKHDSQSDISMETNQRYWFYGDGFAEINLDLIDVLPQSCWDRERALIVSRTESDGSTTCRTLARFRHTDEGSRDFVIVLEMDQQNSCVEPQCCVMICSRDTSLKDLAENIRYMSQKVSGSRSANNGIFGMYVTCESSTRERIILIRPHVMSSLPVATFDATLELQKLALRLGFTQILVEEGQNEIQNRELEQKVKEESTRLEQTERELGVVEDELRKLVERKRILAECKANQTQGVVRLSEEQAEIKKKKDDTFARWLKIQRRWDGIHHMDHNGNDHESEAMDCRTLIRWAAEHGHEVTVRQLLTISHVDIDLSKDGRTPLSLATANGHLAVVQLLLATGQVDVDLKGNSGRTPLSIAAERGHDGIVQLLLATGRVDVDSKENHTGPTPLSYAVLSGNKAVVKLLLEKGAQLESKDDKGRTPLSRAAWNGHETVVQLLLERGAELESKDEDGRTPLSWAAGSGHKAVVRVLLENGAELESKDNRGQTPLVRTAASGHETVARVLLEKGAQLESKDADSRTPLSWAAENGYAAVLRLLLKQGAEIDTKDKDSRTPILWAAESGHRIIVQLLIEQAAELESWDKDSRTPLWWAARQGHEAVVKLLLETGKVDADSKDKYGQTPLVWAAWNGNEAIVRLLLDIGKVDADSKSNNGRTPVSWAAGSGHEAVVQLLLATAGVDADSKDQNGRTPVSWAAGSGHEAIVQLLLATAGVDADSKDQNGRTPLLWAAEDGHEAVVQLLLETGKVDADAKDKDYGQTPLVWAAWNGNEAIVRLLLETGKVDADSNDNNGQTPLSWAAENGHKAVVQLLLAITGVDADSKDKNGRTPLSWAAENGHKAVVQLLLAITGVDADSKDKNGRTPLSWAAGSGHEAVVQLLLATAGVDADSKDKIGRTPLSWAAGSGHEAVVQLLLTTAGVDADSKDKTGRTPLSWAAGRGHDAVAQLLLLATLGVDTNSKDKYGQTPLLWAARSGHEAVVKLLLATGGIDADSKDKIGRTPLSWAAGRGREDIVQLLLTTAGVDADSKGKNGRTPLSWAAEGGHEAVAQRLLEHQVNTDSKDNNGQTPQSYAAQRGHERVLMLLGRSIPYLK